MKRCRTPQIFKLAFAAATFEKHAEIAHWEGNDDLRRHYHVLAYSIMPYESEVGKEKYYTFCGAFHAYRHSSNRMRLDSAFKLCRRYGRDG